MVLGYKTVFKTKKQAIRAGKIGLKKAPYFRGVRGGYIKPKKARIVPIRVMGGYSIIVKRKK